jgi:sulfate transporter 2, low-affinity
MLLDLCPHAIWQQVIIRIDVYDLLKKKQNMFVMVCLTKVFAGSFSRTAVNFSAGARSTMSNIVMSITVFIALELFMKFLYYTPMAVLASIILSALPGLIDIKEACNIWKVDKMDFLTCLGAFVGVLFGSVEIGLAVAVRCSI